MVGGNVLHHVKRRGNVREGEMSGEDMSGGICPAGYVAFVVAGTTAIYLTLVSGPRASVRHKIYKLSNC